MLTKWNLFNFKSVQTETELPLAPLTIFAGPNSSGKSTWIQSILLISQTISSKVPSPSAVVLNGQLAKLGQFDDLRSYGSGAEQILIGWECEPRKAASSTLAEETEIGLVRIINSSDTLQKVTGEIYFEASPSGSDIDLSQLQPRLFRYSMSCISEDEDQIDPTPDMTITPTKYYSKKLVELQVSPSDVEAARNSLECDVKLNENVVKDLRELGIEPVGCTFSHHFLPNQLVVRYNDVEEEARYISSTLIEAGFRISTPYMTRRRGNPTIPEEVTDFLKIWLEDFLSTLLNEEIEQTPLPINDLSGASTLRDWVEALQPLHLSRNAKVRRKLGVAISEKLDELNRGLSKSIAKTRNTPYSLRSQQLPRKIRTGISYLDSFFSNSVKYLGPLRDEPKPLYPLAPTVDPSDVGLRGEYTAAVFDRYKDKLVTYISTSCFPDPKDGRSLEKDQLNRTLKAAVLDWLKYLEIAEDLQTKDMGKLGHELKVTLPGLKKEQDLMHVGVGVSQVLPILVMCLLAEKDTTLIFEQPELHLHPLVQTRLADFFLSMALLGKQCIIETHSEYLINRLRFRVASDIPADPRDTLAEQIKIYFAEKVDGASHYREVAVNKYGAIVDWPQGFFDQSQREAEEILRASMAKRKQERQKKQEQQGKKIDD